MNKRKLEFKLWWNGVKIKIINLLLREK